MSKVWRIMGHYNAETQAYSALAGTFGASPWTPDFNGRLVGVRLIAGQEAATSLTCGVAIRMTCAKFSPNTMEFCLSDNGIATAPAAQHQVVDYVVDQPILAGVGVTLEGKNDVATAVTVSVIVMGCFEVS